MIIKDSIEINAPPQEVYQWFNTIASNYCEWHKDHILAKWLKGNSFTKGSVLYAEEKLHGEIHKLKFKVKKVEKYKLIEYKNFFPINLISPKGAFYFEESNSHTIFTATLTFRMGKLLLKILKKQANQLMEHMKEEGINLKQIIEKK